jgi:DNA topoisomerase-2
LDDTNLVKAEEMGLLKALKMTSNISVNNLVCFDKDGKIRKYESPEEILKEFYDLRLEYYVKRKVSKTIVRCVSMLIFENSNI